MRRRLLNRTRYLLERWIQGGPWNQLLFVAGIIALISALGGVLAWALTGAFANPADAIWWSFLRLSDPGYLGEDEGAVLRLISTVITVLGYVLFLGSLIAIMTQWLHQTMRRLEAGMSPITIGDHILILGWTNRTPSLVRELVEAEKEHLQTKSGRRRKRTRIVILAEDVGPVLRHELRESLGPNYDRWKIIVRSGSPLRIEHLRRVDLRHAATILIPGSDVVAGGHELSDARTIKTLMSINRHVAATEEDRPLPAIVAEILDEKKTGIARAAYRGPIEVVSGDSFISRLIAQNVRHRGLSYVYAELLTHARGNEIYVSAFPEIEGLTFGMAQHRFEEAVLLGIVRWEGEAEVSHLNPPADFVLRHDDRLVAIARTGASFAPSGEGGVMMDLDAPSEPIARVLPALRRILILGWNHRVPALLAELAQYAEERFDVDVLSVVPVEKREEAGAAASTVGRVDVRHLLGDFTDLRILGRLDLASYQNVVMLASDWVDTSEEADARTVLGYVVIQTLLDSAETKPELLIELLDPANGRLFGHRENEVVVSPVMLSHLLAHIALRRELGSVFGELFGPRGAEILLRPVSDFGLGDGSVRFSQIRSAAMRHREIALGVQIARPKHDAFGVYLNPSASREWTMRPEDRAIVLATV